ncbi:MAG: methyltransferase domain-containing protein [Methanobacteriota archaeon]|nr:MAG: methyltransferase domain-containing protein [Euryarchaeota archaeon]
MEPTRVVLLEPSGRKQMVVLDRDTVKVPGLGVVRAETLVARIGRRWTVGGRSFLVLTPSIRDTVNSVSRKAQIVGPKDLPALVWNTDVKPGDFVIEVGSGSGAVTVVLANAVGPEGRVVSYDLRSDFLTRARENVAAAGLSERVEFKVGDPRSEIAERDADAFIVDIPDPWEAVRAAEKALRPCGHFASYSPNVEQVNRTVASLRARTFVEIRTVEIIEREIEASESGTRPSFAPLGHTGYLTFARSVLETL